MPAAPTGFELTEAQAAVAREEAGQTLHIRNADGSLAFVEDAQAPDGRRPVTIRVAGSHAKVFREAYDAQRRQLVQQREPLTPEQRAQLRLELIASCVLAWDGFTNAGAPFPCTPANAVLLLATAPWIADAVEEAITDHQRFFVASSSA